MDGGKERKREGRWVRVRKAVAVGSGSGVDVGTAMAWVRRYRAAMRLFRSGEAAGWVMSLVLRMV